MPQPLTADESPEVQPPEVEAVVQFLREEPTLLRQVQKVAGHQRRSVSKLQARMRGRSIRRSPVTSSTPASLLQRFPTPSRASPPVE